MKIIFVCGGSYKSFYLNHYLKLNRCDLLVFNFGVIYDYDLHIENSNCAIVKPELITIAKRLKAIVVAGVNVLDRVTIKKSILVCDGNTITLKPASKGAFISIKNKRFVVGSDSCTSNAENKIILSNRRIYPIASHCSLRKVYVFCDKFGLCLVQNGKIKRKFNKYSKIILK